MISRIVPIIIVFFYIASTGCAVNNYAEVNREQKARALEKLGLSYVAQGNLRAALRELLKAEELEPDNIDIHHELAMVYKDLGEYDFAEKHFQKVLAMRPRFPEARNNLGSLYLLTRDWDKAIEAFQEAATDILYKTPHYAYNNLGLAYHNKGQYHKAIASYLKAVELSPSYGSCYKNLGLAYEAIGEWNAARASYEKAISLSPEDPGAHFFLARMYLKFGLHAKAADELRQAIQLDPNGSVGAQADRLLNQIE
ncbi:MAG: tetratricopeptide repeat protein [Desulfatiglandales bacterium]